MMIKKSTLQLVIVLVIVVVAGNFLLNFESGSVKGVNGNIVSDGSEVQEVVVGMKDYNYYPNTVNVEAGKKVRMRLDESVFGCFRDLTLRDFGIHEYLATPDDYIEFIPEKKGTYKFACSMGMGYGNLVVE